MAQDWSNPDLALERLKHTVLPLASIPTDQLASELMRRGVIKWLHARCMIEDHVLAQARPGITRLKLNLLHELCRHCMEGNLVRFQHGRREDLACLQLSAHLPIWVHPAARVK